MNHQLEYLLDLTRQASTEYSALRLCSGSEYPVPFSPAAIRGHELSQALHEASVSLVDAGAEDPSSTAALEDAYSLILSFDALDMCGHPWF